MQKSVLGNEFRLTIDARDFINSIIQNMPRDKSNLNLAPYLSWRTADSSNIEYIPGPVLAFDESIKAESLDLSFYSWENTKVFILLDGPKVEECRQKILDYRANRLTLIYPSDFS